MRLIGYVRVSTEEQGLSGLGLEAQRAGIESYADARGWRIARWEEDVISSRRAARPGLEAALESCRHDRSIDGLVVAKLDRLGRSVHEVSGFLAEAARQGWAIVSLTPAVDMTDPYGKAMAHMALVFAELERDMISMRTKEALAAKRARGEKLGPAVKIEPSTEALIVQLARRGSSHRGIAAILTDRGIPTTNGGPWMHTTVQRVLARNPRRRHLRSIR